MALEQGVVGKGVSDTAVAPSRGVSESATATAQMPVFTLDRAEAQLAAQRQQQQDFAQTLVQTRQLISDSHARGAASDWRLTEILMGAAVLATLLGLMWIRWRSSQTRTESIGGATKFSPSAFDQELGSQRTELPFEPIREPSLAVTPPTALDSWNGMPVVLAHQFPLATTPNTPLENEPIRSLYGEAANGPPAALEDEVQKVLRSLAQKRQARTQPVTTQAVSTQPAAHNVPNESFGVDIELELENTSTPASPSDSVSLLLDLSQSTISTATKPEQKAADEAIDVENIRSQWEANLYLAQELEKLGQHDEASSMYQEVIDHGDPASRKEANSLMHAYPRVNKISD